METEVAIVGGGPVGLGLAVDLGMRGVEVVLVEKADEVHGVPKGQNLTQRTMEHFAFWGVEDDIRRARIMPPDFPAAGLNAYGDLSTEYAYAWFKRSEVDPYYFRSNERLPQYLTEKVLRDRAEGMEGVSALYGTRASEVQDLGSSATVATDAGEIEAAFVIGCDGSHSITRESAGIAETRSDHDRKMVLLVFRSPELHKLLERRHPKTAFFNVLHPDLDGYWRFLGRVDVGETWFFHAPVDPGSDEGSFDHESLLHDTVGATFPVDLEYIGFWDLRIAFADDYRKGRVLIAGDAAHSHPPYGGYGINTGLEDARNLGWKLAATLAGWGGPHLLDSYSTERRAVFASTARDFIEAFIERDRRFISAHDPDVDADAFARAWDARRRSGSNLGVSEYAPHYEGSPLVIGSEGSEPSAVGRHTLDPRPGHHLPPPAECRGFFSTLGEWFTLVVDGRSEQATGRFRRAASQLGIPLEIVESAAYTVPAMLVRPDHYVGWVDDGSTFDPGRVLARAVGQ